MVTIYMNHVKDIELISDADKNGSAPAMPQLDFQTVSNVCH